MTVTVVSTKLSISKTVTVDCYRHVSYVSSRLQTRASIVVINYCELVCDYRHVLVLLLYCELVCDYRHVLVVIIIVS